MKGAKLAGPVLVVLLLFLGCQQLMRRGIGIRE